LFVVGLLIAPSSQDVEPPANPVRFSSGYSMTARITHSVYDSSGNVLCGVRLQLKLGFSAE
jgi:hypothetical protein